MTSETETLKTNEFLRRRKLRLQQVREQSKDIAKKIRQRAKVETLRQVVDLDANKQKEYFDRQEKLVKRLEVLYARGLKNVGASHQSASELTLKDEVTKTDISKLRGKEAAAELRKKRQEKLDQQKKLLDRKLQAREAANELSREKTLAVANKPVPESKVPDEIAQNKTSTAEVVNNNRLDVDNNKDEQGTVTKNDMGTQWDIETIPNEWEPSVPALKLPIDDLASFKGDDHGDNKSERSKRLDLFALSKEMPSDLRGRHAEVSEVRDTVRPSLTLVSEYLQTRKLRLRETEAANPNKKRGEDMSKLKQTILRTRTTMAEGSPFDACQVLDEQIIPVPSWRAERSCQFCSNSETRRSSMHTKQFQPAANSQINRIYSSIRPVQQSDMVPSPVLRSTSPFRRNKVCHRFTGDKGSTGTGTSKPETVINKKNAVIMYNHVTRDTRDATCDDAQFVVRDPQCSEDAYSQAMKEVSVVHEKNKAHQKKVQDMRNKVAVTKQTVEKEYKDTINFLNSMPKDKGKVSKVVFMDEHRQQQQKENRQHKMQQEYRKIERECRKHHSCSNKSHNESRSHSKQNEDDDFDGKDFQYSWMPVPEGDGNLAIHTIPTSVKGGKSGNNSVKFNQVDSYHEYRSRHKHTPPTKDTTGHDKHSFKKRVEAVIIDKSASQSYGESSSISSSSSVESLKLDEEVKSNQDKLDQKASDAERIIIYKILDTKNNKHSKRKNKLLSEIAKSLTSIEKGQKPVVEDNSNQTEKRQIDKNGKQVTKISGNSVSFEQINEGVYKIAEDQGDNLSYFEHLDANGVVTVAEQLENSMCLCKKVTEDQKKDKGTILQWEDGDNPASKRTPKSSQYSSTSKGRGATPSIVTHQEPHHTTTPVEQPSASTLTSSFKTVSDKTNSTERDYIKLVDEAGQEASKFLLGAAGFLKDNAYEVVIQLRKKDGSKEDKSLPKTNLAEPTKQSGGDSKNAKVRSSNSEIFESANTKSSHSKTTEKTHPHPEINAVSESNSVSEKTKESEILSPRTTEHKSNATQVVIENGSDNTQDRTVSSNAFTMNDQIRLINSSEKIKDTSDKGTNLEDYDPTPASNPDPPSRPATTTYTQTTNSPVHRPVYFHMSSSTSTAYMSPPEMILPKFLRRDSGLVEFETYESKDIDTVHKHAHYGKNYKKCRHVRKTLSDMHIQGVDFKKNNKIAPPNSTRSCRNDYTKDASDNFEVKRTETTCRISKLDKTKCKCHKSSLCRDCTKKQCLRNIETCRSALNVNTRNKNKSANSASIKKSTGASLNPMVRNYINKLLALNKEGLKVIEVADQECSPVGTPGSSIINVPYNVDERKSSLSNKISIAQIKQDLLQRILDENLNSYMNYPRLPVLHTSVSKPNNYSSWKPRRKPVHKVKSLNISKHLLKKNKAEKAKPTKPVSFSTTDDSFKTFGSSLTSGQRPRTWPSPRHSARSISIYQQYTTKRSNEIKIKKNESRKNERNAKSVTPSFRKKDLQIKPSVQYPSHKATITDTSLDSDSTKDSNEYYKNTADIPISMSTQTSQNLDSDFVKLAENKLYNMEKIADLTEKCTKRLSNLAKVLEEVRKNKSLAYSQISASDSADSHDHKSDKEVKTRVPTPIVDKPNRRKSKSPDFFPETDNTTVTAKEKPHSEYITILSDIPKFQLPELNVTGEQPLNTATKLIRPIPEMLVLTDSSVTEFTRCRQKPPPALSRIHLKHDQEYIVPHELSTVLEVDSPMSVKNKLQSSRNEPANNSNRSSNEDKEPGKYSEKSATCKSKAVNPDLLQCNQEWPKQSKFSSAESSDDSKFQMIDLKHFNEIMLEPFISIQEYAKKYNVEAPDEGSNFENLHREDAINDDMSSLHSDGSLPDVIAELLKRNIITEPFKFDTGSNVNSNTFSSESTLSMLALSKARKTRKRSSVMFQNKENIGETSDTLSFSSNPDLENAFKKLGMGWASSTLKKTKERLALSSSSNTSSSSLSQFKIKTFNQDIPALVTDSVSSVLLSKGLHGKKNDDNSMNVEQQTSFANPMTVKDFLTNELANKITFTNNKSGMNDTEDEFVSLFETKMPEGLKQQSLVNREELSNDSARSGINRARTSTPVQIFKSMTYQSSASSNVSNGLFSNVDDLSSVKMTSNSMKNHSTSDKDDLTIPNFSLKMKKVSSDGSKSD